MTRSSALLAAAALGLILLLLPHSTSSMLTTPAGLLLVGFAAIGWRRQRRRPADAARDVAIAGRRRVEDAGFHTLHGVGADLLFDDFMLVIRRHGTASLLIHGLKGDKRVPVTSVTAIQFREPDHGISGYIQFSLLGALESRAGIWDASRDENTVLFTPDQRDGFADLRDRLERRLARPPQAPVASVADELTKLAGLRDAGVLTTAEFDRQKGALLDRAA